MQSEPGNIPGSDDALAKFSRNYAELYWDFNESIPRPLDGQEVPENGFILTPKVKYLLGRPWFTCLNCLMFVIFLE